MGFFEFIKDAGKKLFGHGDDNEAVKKEIETSFEETPVENLEVKVEGDTVKVAGKAKDKETATKVALIAGNIEGVTKVDTSELENADVEETIYVIKKGDTLWKIAQTFYNDGSKYVKIVEANKEVIKDADKIYPGQSIVIPKLDK